MIDRDDLLRYGQHGLTYRIVDRIFQQAPRRFACQTPGKMGYEDFVYFILSEEDKTTDASLKYWHRCADLDDDGIVTAEDMRCDIHTTAPRTDREILICWVYFPASRWNNLFCGGWHSGAQCARTISPPGSFS